MSERYEFMIEWAKARVLLALEGMTAPDFSRWAAEGVDSLGVDYQELNLVIFRKGLEEESYELSYNQMCNAFDRAFREKGWLPE